MEDVRNLVAAIQAVGIERAQDIIQALVLYGGQVEHAPPQRARPPKGVPTDHDLIEGGNKLLDMFPSLSGQRGRHINPNSLRQRAQSYLREHGGDSTETIAQALGQSKAAMYSSLSQLKYSKLVRGGMNGWWIAEQATQEVEAA
jgi:hypothetical protein